MLQCISSNFRMQHFSLKLAFILHFNLRSYTLACFTSCGSNTKERKSTSQINCNYHRFILPELCKASSAQACLASNSSYLPRVSLLTCTCAWKYPLYVTNKFHAVNQFWKIICSEWEVFLIILVVEISAMGTNILLSPWLFFFFFP